MAGALCWELYWAKIYYRLEALVGFFKRKAKPTPATQIEMMEQAKIPVFLSKLHSEHPPRWVTVRGDRLESVVGLESGEYMANPDNHEVWSVQGFVEAFPFVKDFLNSARPGQSGFFSDQSGQFTIEED